MSQASEYLETYCRPLLESLWRTLPASTETGQEFPSEKLLRNPKGTAQSDTILAGVGCLNRRHRLWLRGECGVGKTYVSCGISHLHANGRPYLGLVMCPGHLTDKWESEIESTIPGAVVYQVEGWSSAVKIKNAVRRNGVEWVIVGRDRAKLGPSWDYACMHRGGLPPVCPTCGSVLKAIEGFCRSCGDILLTAKAPYRWYPYTILEKMRPDYFIGDEAHELAGAKSDQGIAFGGMLSSARNKIVMTGTLSNGTAESMFYTLFRLMPDVMRRLGFIWEKPKEFVNVYGRVEKTVKYADGKPKRAWSRSAPGIMPSLFGDALLEDSIFLSLDQVSADLPRIERTVVSVPMDDRMRVDYDGIKQLFSRELNMVKAVSNNQIMGCMLNTLLCWPDHPTGWGHVGYNDGTDVVALLRPPEHGSSVTAKERKLIEIVRQERSCGRRVWVYCQYTGHHDVAGRLAKLLSNAGLKTEVLRQHTVKPKDRTKWIDSHGPGADVVVSHPRLIQTGVDLFALDRSYNFPTLVFYETGYQTNELRQAGSRALRIGQWLDCKVIYLHYEDTLEEKCVQLMGRKILAAESIEGAFSADGLAAMADDESIQSALARAVLLRRPPSRGLLDAMSSLLE